MEMRRNSSGSCMVPGLLMDVMQEEFYSSKYSMERKACIRLIGGSESEEFELPLYVMQEKLLFWLKEELDERVAFLAVTEISHVISPMCQFRNSLYC